MSEHPASLLKSGQPTGALALIEVLPLMVGESRSGRLSAEENGGSQLHVWLEDGRVVHVTWGQLSGLSALELAAIFLPRSSFVFTEGLQPAARTFELSPVVLASRLAEVAREAAPFVPVIPGPQAKPSRVKKSPGVISPDMARLLARIDGQQTVSDLVDNRQPLTVLRPLARLVQAGAISFEPAAPAEPAETVTQHVEPAAAEVGPARHDPVESVPDQPAEVQSGAGAESQKAAEAESEKGLPAVPLAAGASQPAEAATPRRGCLSATAIPAVALTALVLIIGAIVLGVRASTSEAPEPLALQATAAPTEVPTAAPTQVPTAAPTEAPTAAPTEAPTAAPTQVPTAAPTEAPTAAPTQAPTAAPTQAPTAAPTEVPTAAPTQAPTAAPTEVPTAAPTQAPTAAPTQAPTAVAAVGPLLDESFANAPRGWPNSPDSSAFWDTQGYHLVPRIAGQHVAIGASLSTSLTDVTVTGLFRKIAGPVGGGYGLVIRAQGTPLDGSDQGGRYYVFEVGDRGQVGAWRRDQDHWVDLLPWTDSAAVQSGAAENGVVVRAIGSQFTFAVNNQQVAQVSDAALSDGAVGVFVGGDGNQVLLERFGVTVP